MERPDQTERKISFNPEAAAFSPTMASIIAAEASSAASGHTEMASLGSGISALQPEDLLLRSNRNMHPTSVEEGNLAPVSVSIGAPLAQGIAIDVLMRTLEEHRAVSTQGLMDTSINTQGCSQQAMDNSNTYLPTCTFPFQPTEPNLNLVDIDELSAGLGLPSAKDSRTEASPTHTHRSRPSQGVPNALYGKLIDRALNKPLTADALAHYMQSRSESSDDTIRPSQDQRDPFVDRGTSKQEQAQASKVVRPPPGFGMQMPRMVTVEDEHTPKGPAIMQRKIAQAAPSGHFHQYPGQGQTGTPFQHHARHHSSRKRPRGYTRTKRTDQGPEPSAADIYPDDAHWTPTQQPFRQNYFSPPAHMPPPPVVQVEDPVSWPTPAEVYTNEPQAPAPLPAHVPQLFNPHEAHVSPTAQELSAADNDVHSLLHELPEPSINTLINFNAFDLLGDERSFSPDQCSGKRYGVNFYGIGLGDEWQPPQNEGWGESAKFRNDSFRVRPRDHEGWGGWEWAIGKGWANQ